MMNKIKEFRYRRLKYKTTKNILRIRNREMISLISFMLMELDDRGMNAKEINSVAQFKISKMPYDDINK